MTNKQAYAGLLERLVAEFPTFGRHLKKMGVTGYLRNPDGPEAAEAISSLLKALEFYATEWVDGDERKCFEKLPSAHLLHDAGFKARAALNSDAPLSIGEEQ